MSAARVVLWAHALHQFAQAGPGGGGDGVAGMAKIVEVEAGKVVRIVEQIEGRAPRSEEAAFLGLTEAQQVLEVTRIAYADSDRPVEAVTNVFPSQQWRLSYEWSAEQD